MNNQTANAIQNDSALTKEEKAELRRQRRAEKAAKKLAEKTGLSLVQPPTAPTGATQRPVVTELPKLPRRKSGKSGRPKQCACGCNQLTSGGNFMPGHDAILHAWALRKYRGQVAEVPFPHTEAVEAEIARALAAADGKGLTGKKIA